MPTAPKVIRYHRTKRAPEHRPNSAQRGYNMRWRRASAQWLREQFALGNVLCGECGKALDGSRSDIHVDHIVDHKGDYDLMWDESNWQALHARCHGRKTARENRR